MQSLHVDTGRRMQGGQWQVLYLAEGLKDATVMAPAGSPLSAECEKRGLRVVPLSLLAMRRMARKVDVVHAHDARAHMLAGIVGGVPLVVSRRVGFPIKRGFLSSWKYTNAAMYLAVSKYVVACLIDGGVRARKIRVVHDGVPIPEESGRKPGRVVALASKPVQIPGISVDHTERLWDVLRDASVFVYKSEMEGLGSASLAAQAAGVPVVVSDVGGLPETVIDGETGFVVRGGDFETPVKRLLNDAGLAARMGQAARERIQREFTIDKMIQQTLQAYRELPR